VKNQKIEVLECRMVNFKENQCDNNWRGWKVSEGFFAPEGFYLLIPGVSPGFHFDQCELLSKDKEEND
jgi:hypothetical protein